MRQAWKAGFVSQPSTSVTHMGISLAEKLVAPLLGKHTGMLCNLQKKEEVLTFEVKGVALPFSPNIRPYIFDSDDSGLAPQEPRMFVLEVHGCLAQVAVFPREVGGRADVMGAIYLGGETDSALATALTCAKRFRPAARVL